MAERLVYLDPGDTPTQVTKEAIEASDRPVLDYLRYPKPTLLAPNA